MNAEINQLTKAMSSFIKESSERSTRLETTQEHISSAVLKISSSVEASILSNTKLESKISVLESRALDRLNLVEDSVNEIHDLVEILNKRTHMLEVINANTQGKEEVANRIKKCINDNWFKLFMVIAVSIPLVVYLYEGVVGIKSSVNSVKGK